MSFAFDLSWLDLLALVLAGAAAGLINTVVGSGTLITFPTLLALGVPPVLANVSNTIGLAPGSLSGALSMRRELAGQRRRVLVLGSASFVGALAEERNHHPDLLLHGYRHVRVMLTTHDAGDRVTDADRALAEAISAL